jgi:hypothetical protein
MFLDHTKRRTTVGRTPLDERSALHRPLPDNTWHSQQTNIHAPGGSWTHDISRWVAASCSPAEIVGSTPTGGVDICCCECCVMWGRGLCDELIARPEEAYRMWYVVVCDLETSRICTPYIYDICTLRVKYQKNSSSTNWESVYSNLTYTFSVKCTCLSYEHAKLINSVNALIMTTTPTCILNGMYLTD